MKKIALLLLLISLGVNSQTRIRYSQMENPATSSVNLGTQTFSVSTITGSVIIGTGTVAANTSSLGIVRIKSGSGFLDFGGYGSFAASAIWFNQSTPSVSNYGLYGNASTTEISGVSNVNIGAGAGTRVNVTSTGMRVGSAVAPSATLDVTGTMSVSGTSTLTGAAKQTNTLNYEGNTTWNTNQTNTLTTGNTGTVAVLSDAVFSQDFICMYSVNPTDATTYYFSNMLHPTWLTSTSGNQVLIPYNSTMIGYSINYIVNGTLGSSETATLQIISSGSSTDLNTSLSYTSASNTYTASGLNISINAGSMISAKLITPTWGTDPTNLRMGITFWFVRRQ